MSILKNKASIVLLLSSIIILLGLFGFQTTISSEEGLNKKKQAPETSEKLIEPYKVATIQYNPTLYEREKNVDELVNLTEEAFKNGAKLVVAPEMATTGYMYKNREDIAPFVDTIPGKTTKRFEKITRKYDGYIVFGMPEVEKETDLYYNSAALVGPEGYIGKYRKTHLWETEMHWSPWGNLGVPVFETKIGDIAINICMDSAYFESARLAGVQGADILAFPTNSSAQAVSALPARASQNGMYVISSNRSNTEKGFHMIGASAIWSPFGGKLAAADFSPNKEKDIEKPQIVYAEVDPSKFDNKSKKALKNRRPELYKELAHYIQPWDYTQNTESHQVTATALQYEPEVGNKNKNMKKINRLVDNAISQAEEKEKTLDLVVLPELSVTGPMKNLNVGEIKKLAETLQGKTTSAMKDIAEEHQTAIVYGLVEKQENKLYNSAVLINKDGEIVGKYRKTHLSENNQKWATKGSKLPVFETESLGKIGLLIGDDARYPETAGVLSVKRADMIAIPSSWSGQYGRYAEINPKLSANRYPDNTMILWDSIAMSAQAYTIVANYVGTEENYLGGSALYTLDPLYGLDQPVTATEEKEEALLVEFNTIQSDWWFNQDKLLKSRQPDYYTPLVK